MNLLDESFQSRKEGKIKPPLPDLRLCLDKDKDHLISDLVIKVSRNISLLEKESSPRLRRGKGTKRQGVVCFGFSASTQRVSCGTRPTSMSPQVVHFIRNIDRDTLRPQITVRMSSRRLVNRARANEESLPQQHPRHHASEAEPTPLPPYEPPTCALTPTAQRALETLRASHDYSKYKRHLDGSIKAITNSVGDSNDRLRVRKEEVAKAASRRRQGEEGEEKSAEDKERETVLAGMETNIMSLTTKAEKAIRDLIDYSDELAMKDTFMRELSEHIAAASLPRQRTRRQRSPGSNEDEDEENEEIAVEENDEPEPDGSVISALELLKKAQVEYATAFASRSMRSRYGTIQTVATTKC